MDENKKVVIELKDVKRYFQVGSETVKALGLSGHTDQWRIFSRWYTCSLYVKDPARSST